MLSIAALGSPWLKHGHGLAICNLASFRYTRFRQVTLLFSPSPPSGEKGEERSMGVWQGGAMDSLKFHPNLSCPVLLCPAGQAGWAGRQGKWPAAVFYPFGHPYGKEGEGEPIMTKYGVSKGCAKCTSFTSVRRGVSTVQGQKTAADRPQGVEM
jgi:hypothetical protein